MNQLTPKQPARRGRIFPELTLSAEELSRQEAEDEVFYQRCWAIFKYIDHENDLEIVLHTLFNSEINLEKIIYNSIDNSDIKLTSKERCKQVYQYIKDANDIDDLAALNLLDFIVAVSQLNPSLIENYNIASQSYRLIKIENFLEKALEASHLNQTKKQCIRGTYQCIRAGENIADFDILNQLDSIIQNSALPDEIKQIYFRQSITSRAITADLFIINLINNSIHSDKLFTAYSEIRDGKQVSDEMRLKSLDSFILNSDIPDDCKVIYQLMREPATNQKKHSKGEDDVITTVKKFKTQLRKHPRLFPLRPKLRQQ